MHEISKDDEILDKLEYLQNKFALTLYGATLSDVTPTDEQRVRLIQQLDSITTTTDRFIKNLLLLLGEGY